MNYAMCWLQLKSFFRYFKWGAANHPGNIFYLMIVTAFGVVCLRNKTINPITGFFIGIGVAVVLLLPLYIITSYLVGKANASLIDKEENSNRVI